MVIRTILQKIYILIGIFYLSCSYQVHFYRRLLLNQITKCTLLIAGSKLFFTNHHFIVQSIRKIFHFLLWNMCLLFSLFIIMICRSNTCAPNCCKNWRLSAFINCFELHPLYSLRKLKWSIENGIFAIIYWFKIV